MGFILSNIFAFLTVTVLVASHAAAALPLPPQLYWKSTLPYTRMPKFISELIRPDFVSVGKGNTESTSYNQDAADDNQLLEDPNFKILYNYGPEDAADGNQLLEDPNFKILYNYGPEDAADGNQLLEDPNFKILYNYGQDAANGKDPTTLTLFFFEKDLHPGKAMKLRLPAGSNGRATPFLSRKTANLIPFSSSKLPEILNQFSVKPGSAGAHIMTDAIQHCENPGVRGENKYCATSLESMIDHITSKLGRNIRAIFPEVEKGSMTVQNYTIMPQVKKLADGDEFIVCHKMNYVYAVFFCHAPRKTRAYLTPLEGADGANAKAVAVCHEDTSEWSPNYLAFQVLKVKPGSIDPICHFLSKNNIVWFQTKNLHYLNP